MKMRPNKPFWGKDAQMLLVIHFWGLTFLFTKMGLQSFTPLSFAHVRIASAGMALLLMAAVNARQHGTLQLRLGDHLLALVLGLLGMTCFPFCFTLAMQHTSAANAGLIFGTTPVAVALLSWLLGLERLSRIQWLGLTLSVAGIALVMLAQGVTLSLAHLQGDLLMLGAMFNWAMYTVLNRFVPAYKSSLQFTAYAALWGLAGLTLLSYSQWSSVSLQAVSPLAWLGGLCAGILSTAMAYVIWNNSVRDMGPAKTAVYLNLVPLVAAISGFVLLNEALGWQHLGAAVLIIAGVLLTRNKACAPDDQKEDAIQFSHQ